MTNSTNFFELVREFQDNINWLNQVLLGDENKTVMVNGTPKPSISKDINEKWSAISAIIQGGRLVFETKSALLASGGPPADVFLAEVWRDSSENNGLYGWTGSDWEKSDWDNVTHLKAFVASEFETLKQTIDGDELKGIKVMAQGMLPDNTHLLGAIIDKYGNMLEGWTEEGEKIQTTPVRILDELRLKESSSLAGDEFNYDYAITDENNNVIFGILNDKIIALDLKKIGQLEISVTKLESSFDYLSQSVSNAGTSIDEIKQIINFNENTGIALVEKGNLSQDVILLSAVTDEYGNMLESWTDEGEKIQTTPLILLEDITIEKNIFGSNWNYDFAVVDHNNNVAFGVVNGDVVGSVVATEKQTVDNNIFLSLNTKTSIHLVPCRNVFDWNHLITYGQSLSTGQESWPRLSKTSLYGNMMIGDSVRPKGGTNFIPYGEEFVLKPHIATVADGGLLSDIEVADLPRGNQSNGETVSEGWANMAKFLHNDHLLKANDERVFISSNNGLGGKLISELSKGSSTGIYNRNIDCITKIKKLSENEGKTYGVTGLLWMQGEYDYLDKPGGAASREAYLHLLTKLREDLCLDIKSITGQPREPAFFVYQPGPQYVRDSHKLGVGMALWDITNQHNNAYMVGPVYPVTDKGGHLDANGQRWYGNQVAKVYHRVVTLGQDWKPLSPIKITTKKNKITIQYYVPEPPLRFGKPYKNSNAIDLKNKGFYVTDDSGKIAITGVDISNSTKITITIAREIIGEGKIWYANQQENAGFGNIMDSDTFLAHDKYQYEENVGFYPEANITELLNKPYPLNNWSISFCLPVNWEL